MSNNPKAERTAVGYPAPEFADYSDEISEEQWLALLEEVKPYQTEQRVIISGEPW